MKKGVIITASVLIVLGIALFAGALISSGSDLSIQKYVSERAVFEGEAADFSKIRIIADETDITVKPSEDGKGIHGGELRVHLCSSEFAEKT